MSVKGTRTEQNLLKAFAGEAQARNRYTYFAGVAKKEGYEQIAAIFTETADNEREHAKVFFTYLEGGPVEITATYPAGRLGNTAQNLEAAAAGEKEEWSSLYPDFSQVAEQEGFPHIAESYREIAEVEEQHERRYLKLLANMQTGRVFMRDEPVLWHCRNCGYIHKGTSAPEVCPACKHPQAYYEFWTEMY
ncbi:MAG: rubrerythrin family protein [Actinobacteria bacterium]|nr:rubrerythrin family protein [Actinomycetota bacterium]